MTDPSGVAHFGRNRGASRRGAVSISAVVPMYLEAGHAAALVRALSGVLQSLADRYEIVIVDDGSRDETRERILSVAAECSVQYIELSRRFGKEAALSAGMAAARGDVVVLLDGDGQHPISTIPEMLDRWREGFDMVYGIRRDRGSDGLRRRLGSMLLYRLLSWGSDFEIPANAGDFRLMGRRVVDALNALPERSRFMKGLYAWVGFRSTAVEFDVQPRTDGDSTFSLNRLANLAITGITAFSALPLRCVSAFGLGVSACSLVYGAWVAVDKLVFGNVVAGYPTLVVSIMFFAGVQLISVGILGEYLSRVFDEVKQRPNYVVSDSIDCSLLNEDTLASERQRAERK